MARSPVTDVIKGFENLTPEQQKVCLDIIDPQPEPEPPAKQTRKKRGPSKKAQSLSSTITAAREAKATAPQAGGQRCVAKVPGLDVDCEDLEESPIHDPNAGYGGYHPFAPPAQVATKRSSRKGAAANSIPSTADDSESVLVAGQSGD